VLAWGIAALGPGLALSGLAPSGSVLLPLLAFVGLCSSAIQTGSTTLLQRWVPDEARGRAESALDTLLTVVMMIAMAAAGVAGDRFGARPVFIVAGGLTLVAGLLGRVWLRGATMPERIRP